MASLPRIRLPRRHGTGSPLSAVKQIAEPWDTGTGGYKSATSRPGWAEWNDQYRDTVRRFWKGDEGLLPVFASRFSGSADLHDRRARRPWASINFVTAHDGFTLRDLVSYNEKHNDANNEDNHDGSDNQKQQELRRRRADRRPRGLALCRRQMRNFLATLPVSQGVPMLLGGGEFGRSQGGNNNAYCQDRATKGAGYDKKVLACPSGQKSRRCVGYALKTQPNLHHQPLIRATTPRSAST